MNQEFEEHTAYLINKMRKAVQEDHTAIQMGECAISRLKMIPEVDTELRKKYIQVEFLA